MPGRRPPLAPASGRHNVDCCENIQRDISGHYEVLSVRFTLVHPPNPNSHGVASTAVEVDPKCHNFPNVHEAFSPVRDASTNHAESLAGREEAWPFHGPHISY